ncbi:ABC transporter substrate-binding protein [Winogradskyella sp.]|uniref:ABC transporter substrate-binding protein n=1 Tax=Winogradskyella sp. TaxID=1883156 RepID=UPI00261DA3CE|nr:ABC transporter substrate-binding protein [Winogradskyella sp.]
MKKTILWILFIVIILSTLVYFFAPLSSTQKSEALFTIGVNIPQTGNLSSIGEQIKSGIDLAKSEINDPLLNIKFQDSKGNARDGSSATNYLLDNENPKFIVVNLTSVAMASKPTLSQKNVQAIYLSTHPDITSSCTNCYRFFTSGKQEGDLIVSKILEKNDNIIGLIYVNDAYGKGTVSYIENSLKSISPEYNFIDMSYPISDYDFKAITTRLKNDKVNSIIVIGYGFEYSDLFRSLKQINYSPTVYSNFSFSNKKGKEITDYQGEIIFTAPTYDKSESRTSEMKKFVENYQSKYKTEPDFNAAYGYDNIKIIYEFYKSKQTSFKQFLSGFKYKGAMGTYSFLPNGDVKTQLEIETKNNDH